MEGIVRDYTFTDLDLHDGCYYDVILVACNGARLCTKSQVSNILVDGSPPTPGILSKIRFIVSPAKQKRHIFIDFPVSSLSTSAVV